MSTNATVGVYFLIGLVVAVVTRRWFSNCVSHEEGGAILIILFWPLPVVLGGVIGLMRGTEWAVNKLAKFNWSAYVKR